MLDLLEAQDTDWGEFAAMTNLINSTEDHSNEQ